MSMLNLSERYPPQRLLLGPGPSEPHPRVLRAQAMNLLGHLDPDFQQYMTECQGLLREVFQTANEWTFPVSGTGMAGMECTLVNLLAPGDAIHVLTAGFFGNRMADVAKRLGAAVHANERPWGSVFQPDEVDSILKKQPAKVVAVVQGETSTGALQPLAGLAEVCHRHGSLLLVDAVTSLGTSPVKVDEWQIDAIYSGSQKGLSCPPGLAPVSFSPRAIETIRQRKQPVASYYLDAGELMKYWGSEKLYHHTAPISNIYGLREGLRIVLEEGLEPRWARHRLHSQALAAGLGAMRLERFIIDNNLPALTAVNIPPAVEDMAVRKKLLTQFGIEIGGGLGALKGKAWRIGLMGYGSNRNNVMSVIGGLGECLQSDKAGAALAGVQDYYQQIV